MYKITLNRTLRESERKYCEKKISSAASLQKIWEIFREKLSKNKPRATPTFINNGNDANEAIDEKGYHKLFAKHFSKIGEESVRDLLDESSDYSRFLSKNEDEYHGLKD